ncbi:hypothetical protein [Streptomyces sp. NPDC045714]|uniref:hypothetical protein n=1 Tax=Streptomyces sp. NPDC045714 TaxID=3154913 RepID=UPI0033E585CE
MVRVTDVQGEALFVADLETLCDEAARRAIPTGGRALPDEVEEIRFEKAQPGPADTGVRAEGTSAS